ncbi:hypothetical protein [Dactylosporangium sp. CA-092794]|uniref:hypothetical protein n=1 Tax=Dactylosporangium sp. CA-092794 TaxID=3239929 RepID=UPI003D901E11
MRRFLTVLLFFAAFVVIPGVPASAATYPVQVYGAWHCGNDACTWGTVRTVAEFDSKNHWLIDLDRKATADWLRTDAPVLDYANAMVPSKQPAAGGATSNWQEHLDGKPQYSPPIPPLSPAKFTGSLYVAEGSKVRPECNDFAASLQQSTGSFVQSTGMLGYMFWAAEKPSTRGVGTIPPNTCEGGVGAGATAYQIPIPLPALRQN